MSPVAENGRPDGRAGPVRPMVMFRWGVYASLGVLAVGLIAGLALAPFVTWGLTLVAGWDTAAVYVNSMGPATHLRVGGLRWG